MSEFENQLNSILSSPEALEQIMALANSLSSDGTPPPEGGAAAPTPEGAQDSSPPQGPDLSGLFSLLNGSGSPLGGLDPKLVQAGLDLAAEYGRNDPEQAALLTALRPFLQENRQAKLDRAVQLARMARVIQAAYRIFRERNGGDADHV